MSTTRANATVFAGALLLNLIAWYGGLRSPDSEVVFEQCEAIHDRRTFAVEGVSRNVGFGLAPGLDGRQNAVFGPGEALACVPMLTIARVLTWTRWYDRLPPPPSFYVGDGYERFMASEPPAGRDVVLHAERTVVSLLNPITGALAVLLFWGIARRFARHPAAALAVTMLFAAASPMWPYAGSCFSEPLATLALLVAFACLLTPSPTRLLAGGVALGVATATHVTAILAVPFLAAWAILEAPDRRRAAAWFLAGLGAILVLLAAFNAVRFGSLIETGRFVDPDLARRFGYGHAVPPWRGLYGLTLGPGKGLLLFAPMVALGLYAWPALSRRAPRLAWLLAAMALARLVFLATRSDWHGGFSLGPRLLLMLVPFLLLPIVPWLDERLARRNEPTARRTLALFAVGSVAAIGQQAYLVIGEPFSYYQSIRVSALLRRVDVFAGDRIYLDWASSPLIHLHEGKRGPWLLRAVPLGGLATWAVLSAALAAAFLLLLRAALRRGALLAPTSQS